MAGAPLRVVATAGSDRCLERAMNADVRVVGAAFTTPPQRAKPLDARGAKPYNPRLALGDLGLGSSDG